jgi:hypothetical protein
MIEVMRRLNLSTSLYFGQYFLTHERIEKKIEFHIHIGWLGILYHDSLKFKYYPNSYQNHFPNLMTLKL